MVAIAMTVVVIVMVMAMVTLAVGLFGLVDAFTSSPNHTQSCNMLGLTVGFRVKDREYG